MFLPLSPTIVMTGLQAVQLELLLRAEIIERKNQFRLGEFFSHTG